MVTTFERKFRGNFGGNFGKNIEKVDALSKSILTSDSFETHYSYVFCGADYEYYDENYFSRKMRLNGIK